MRLLALLALTAAFVLLPSAIRVPTARDSAPLRLDSPSLEPRNFGAFSSPSKPSELPAYALNAWDNSRITSEGLDLVRGSGASFYRLDMFTTYVDRYGDGRTTRHYDRIVREATIREITLLPVLMRLRPIQKAQPPRTPAEYAQWQARVGFFASRYGAEGDFWREHPELPYRPIRVWEIWNEPNLRKFWGGRRPDPVEYRRVLAAARAGLRAADPQARVVSAGLAWRHDGGRYLASVLDGGGACLLDAAAIHPYGNSVAESVGHLEEARAILDRYGAREAQLWPTEIGWRVASRGRFRVPTEADQARALSRFATEAQRRRDMLRLGPLFAFPLRDKIDPRTGRFDGWGLLRLNYTPRPAWGAWSTMALAADPLPLPSPACRVRPR